MEEQYLSDRQLAERYHVSRPTIWRWVRKESFPVPISLTAGCTRWRLTDIEEFEASRGGV